MTSYRWALTEYIEQPIKITEQQLIGNPILAQKIPDNLPRNIDGIGKYEYPFLNGLFITTFKSGYILNRNFFDGVIVRLENIIVGFSVDDVTYVIPKYQGKGIGAELLCEKYLYYGVLEKRAKWVEPYPSKAYTENGLKVIKKAYRLLKERGAVYG